MNYLVVAMSLLLFPALTHAATIQGLLVGTQKLIGGFIIPLLIAIAFLAFIYNVLQYFIIQSNSEEGREKAKCFMLYSLSAFVIIISLWGIVNFVIRAVDIEPECMPVPDYLSGSGAPNCSPRPVSRP